MRYDAILLLAVYVIRQLTVVSCSICAVCYSEKVQYEKKADDHEKSEKDPES